MPEIMRACLFQTGRLLLRADSLGQDGMGARRAPLPLALCRRVEVCEPRLRHLPGVGDAGVCLDLHVAPAARAAASRTF